MIGIKDFFFKIFKRFKKVPFERVLINLRKEIDMLCNDEIDGINIINVEMDNKEGEESIELTYSKRKVFDRKLSKYSNKNLKLSSTSFTKDSKLSIYGTIVIKLIENELNYVIVTLSYNKNNQFDMKTWKYFIIKHGTIDNSTPKRTVGYLTPFFYVPNGNLYGDIHEYLIKNKLIGKIYINYNIYYDKKITFFK